MTTRLSAGDRAPDFALTDDRGETVSLGDLRGRKAIVYVYPAAMTPGCTTQACDFSDSLETLTGQGYAVVGVSPDSPEKLARFREKENLTITLLSDPEKEMLRTWGAFGEKKLYGKVVEGVIRSTFVLDEEGVVTHAWYNVKATGHVVKIMRDLGLKAA
jgi:peroxiredoxin Q/BCP